MKLFFNIPIGAHPALVELQNMMRRRLPEGTQFNDPATFHITLVHIEDDKELDLKFPTLADELPRFGVGGDWASGFPVDAGVSVHLCMERSPQLVYLQAAIYYRVQALGAKISATSYPSQWKPHITLATVPQVVMERPAYPDLNAAPRTVVPDFYLNAGLHLDVSAFALTADDSFDPLMTWELRADIPVQEFMASIAPNVDVPEIAKGHSNVQLHEQAATVEGRTRLNLICVSEMAGGVPDVQLPKDVDIEAIKAQLGEDFRFVTLPVGQVDAMSRNDRRYTKKAVQKLADQIKSNRPEGGWGHIKDEDIGTEYENPPIRWLNAILDKNGTVWAKGLPLTPDAQRYYAMARATNARVGTSLYAWAEMDGDDVVDLELIKLDLADPARVGIPMTAAMPSLSTEMSGTGAGASGTPTPEAETTPPSGASAQENPISDIQEQEVVTLDENRIKELEQKETSLTNKVSELEIKIKALEIGQAVAEGVRKALGVAPDADVVQTVTELKSNYDTMATEAQALLATAIQSQIAELVKIESVRPVVSELVLAEKPTTQAAAKAALEGVLARESIKTLLKQQLQEQAGPTQPRPVTPNNPGATSAMEKYFIVPEVN